jgi:hypothetical protein
MDTPYTIFYDTSYESISEQIGRFGHHGGSCDGVFEDMNSWEELSLK